MTNEMKICENTLYFCANYDSPSKTKLCKLDDVVYAKKSAKELLDDACLQNGTSLRGRLDMIRHHTNFKKKLPVPISPSLCFLPSCSPDHADCIWISVTQALSFEAYEKGTLVRFRNGQTLIVQKGLESMRKQWNRACSSMHILARLQGQFRF